jgi:hypothetical protein
MASLDMCTDDVSEFIPPYVAPTDDALTTSYGADVLQRLIDWTNWHTSRGEARGLLMGKGWCGLDALAGLYGALADLYDTWDDAGAGEWLANAITEAREALRDAIAGANADTRRDVVDGDGACFDQVLEVEGSRSLWPLFWAFEHIADVRGEARAGVVSSPEARADASHVLAYAPAAPSDEGVAS